MGEPVSATLSVREVLLGVWGVVEKATFTLAVMELSSSDGTIAFYQAGPSGLGVSMDA